MKVSDPPIITERIIDANISQVWNAITDLTEMKQWFFDNIPEYKAEVGFTCKFDIKNETRIFPHVWKITEVIPQKKIVTNWSFEGYKGESLVHFDLNELGDKTKLLIRTEVLSDFPDEIPEFKRESGVEGWNYFADRLKKYIEK